MKKFLEEYGFAILAAIVVILLIVMSSPVGTTIKTQIMGLINNFGITSKRKVDSLGEGTVVVLTQTPDLIITSKSTTDKFQYVVHYVEKGEDKSSLPREYDNGFVLEENPDKNSQLFVEVIDKGTGEKNISNTIIVPESGFLETEDNKTYELIEDVKSILNSYSAGRVHFVDTKMPETGVTIIEGLDKDGDGGIVGWYTLCEVEDFSGGINKSRDIYISSQKLGQKIKLRNPDKGGLFWGVSSCELFDVSMLELYNTEDMTGTFKAVGTLTKNLQIIGLENWDMSKTKIMNFFFQNAAINVENFTIRGMENWDLSNVEMMIAFFSASGLEANVWDVGDLSNWNTSNVKVMKEMFSGTGQNATTFNIGNIDNWDVSNVADMDWMFNNTAHKADYKLNLSNWNVNKVTKYKNFNAGVESKIIPPIWKS